MIKLAVFWLCCLIVGCGKSADQKQLDERCKHARASLVEELQAARDSIARDTEHALPEEPHLIDNEIGKIQFDDMTAMLAAHKHRRDLVQPTQQAIDAAIAAWSADGDRHTATTAVLERLTAYEQAFTDYGKRIETSRVEATALLGRLQDPQRRARAGSSTTRDEIDDSLILVTQNQLKLDDLVLKSLELQTHRFNLLKEQLSSYAPSCR